MKPIFKGLCAALAFATSIQATDIAEKQSPKPLTLYTPEQIKADIDDWMLWLHRTHPQLTYTIQDIDAFYAEVQAIKDSVDAPLTQAELWQKLTPVNAAFSDGHLLVGYKSNKSYLQEKLADGAKLFPFDILITDQNELVVKSLAGGEATEHRGAKITSINGVSSSLVVAEILKRQHGDTAGHRRTLAEKRWGFLYLATFGSSDRFDLSVDDGGEVREISLAGHGDLERSAYSTKTFADDFSCSIKGDNTAYVKIDQFYWDSPEEYMAFMDGCFTQFRSENAENLIVDIRENGGGDDMFWMAGVMKYVAKVPYRHGSSYKVRILEKYRDPGETIGDVVEGEIGRMRQPETEVANSFDGNFYLLVGPYSYSSSILFANAVKDHEIGKIVGVPTDGKRGQTGGTQRYIFPNTGLKAVSPRFILQPPAGGDSYAPVAVEIPLDTAGLDADKALDAFIQSIEAE
ncbi:MAG: S41 family peptidase [Alphaproteobacteria bacterium]|nr:S41 family peptidase [Alphaproteobacteria bacterium]